MPSTQDSSGLEALQRLTLQLWICLPGYISISILTAREFIPRLSTTIIPLTDLRVLYPRYTRPIVLTMAETDGDKFPLHTAAREGRGTELHAYIPALQS